MKKLIVSIVFTFGLMSLLLTACLCKDVQPYWQPTTGSANVYINDGAYSQVDYQDTIQVNSIEINLVFETIFLSQGATNSFWPLGNVARATQKCPTDGHQGLKYQIEDLTITSDEDFNQFAAGDDLKSIFSMDSVSLSQNYSQLLQTYSYEYLNDGCSRSIYLNEQPANAIERDFTISIAFANGEQVEMTTTRFTW